MLRRIIAALSLALAMVAQGAQADQHRHLTVTYEVAETPGYGLLIETSYADGTRDALVTGPDGRVALRAGTPLWIEVTHPRSGLRLATLDGAAAGTRIEVPRVAILSADIEGFEDILNITVDIGSGAQQLFVDLLAKELAYDGDYSLHFPDRSGIKRFGRIASDWQVTELHGNQRYFSDVVMLDRSGKVDLVVHSAMGEVATRRVIVPDTYEIGDVHHLGIIRPDAAATLAIENPLAGPQMGDGRLWMRLETKETLTEAQLDRIALLMRVNRDVGMFGAGLGRIILPAEGRLALPGLPDLGAVDLVVESVPAGMQLRRPVQIGTDGRAEVTLTAQEVLGEGAPLIAITGRVVDAAGQPIVGARVEIDSFPLTGEATTDADGTYRVDAMRAGRVADIRVFTPDADGYVPGKTPLSRRLVYALPSVQPGADAAPGDAVIPDLTINTGPQNATSQPPAPDGWKYTYLDCSKVGNWYKTLEYVYIPGVANPSLTTTQAILFARAAKPSSLFPQDIDMNYYFDVLKMDLRYGRVTATFESWEEPFFGQKTKEIKGDIGAQYTPFIVDIDADLTFFEPPDDYEDLTATFNPVTQSRLEYMNEQVAFDMYFDDGTNPPQTISGVEVYFPPMAAGAEPVTGLSDVDGEIVFEEARLTDGSVFETRQIDCLNTLYLPEAELTVYAAFSYQGGNYMIATTCDVFGSVAPARILINLVATPDPGTGATQGYCEIDTDPPASRFGAMVGDGG